MVDLTYLDKLLPLLNSNGVQSFKTAGLEIVLRGTTPSPLLATTSHTIDAPEPPNMPPDLRSDSLMSEDHILNWSAPPGPDSTEQEQLPLTGDKPL